MVAFIRNNSANSLKDELEQVIQDTKTISAFPNAPNFFGNYRSFDSVKARRFLRFNRRLPDLVALRADLNDENNIDVTKAQRVRQELTLLANRFPHIADLHALKAIQSYKDLQQSGINENKFSALEYIVLTLGRVINTNSYSLNNLLWFLKIYIHYLELLKKRLLSGYRVENMKYSEAKRQVAVLQQQASKSKKEFDILYAKYERTSYQGEGITPEEIAHAYEAMKRGKDKTLIGPSNRPAKVVHLLHYKINIILSRIPIFTDIVARNLEITKSSVFRDVFLLNGMIKLSQMLNKYYLTLASGDLKAQRELLVELNKKAKENSGFLQDEQNFNKEYEFDPIIKSAVIALEIAKFPFNAQFKSGQLAQARMGLFKIMNRCRSQNAIRLANKYISDIEDRMKDDEESATEQSGDY